MSARQICNDVYSVGVIDWDRTLFDALIPLPHGTSYNSYIVKGSEKVALIDTVEPTKYQAFKANIDKLNLDCIDYIIANHAEQDHSGSIPFVLEQYPEAKVVTNAKCKTMLQELLDIADESFCVINDRDELSLGDKTLEFILAPWVHWPETMLTYLREQKVLFSCDFLGSHMATSSLFAFEEPSTYEEAKRYYAEIMMPFARNIRNHLKTLDDYELELVAPSHGPVHNDPKEILDAYSEWTSERVKNEVLLLYVSMHGSTEQMVLSLMDSLMEKGITVRVYNMVSADIGRIAMNSVDAATLVVASPAVLMGLHPNIAYGAFVLNTLKPKTRYAAVIGSYGWASKLSEQLQGMLGNLKAEFLPAFLTKGHPSAECLAELDALAEAIAQKHAEIL